MEMLYLITGGSGSGKSEYAENLAVRLYEKGSRSGCLYYIATLKAEDEESLERIKRHRVQRTGKGFTTRECPLNIGRLAFQKEDVVLIEDLSNLLANEMYMEGGRIGTDNEGWEKRLFEAIITPLELLEKQAACVILVTNEIFCAGQYMDYVRCLGFANRQLGLRAKGVAEVVCGIPLWQKGEPVQEKGCRTDEGCPYSSVTEGKTGTDEGGEVYNV